MQLVQAYCPSGGTPQYQGRNFQELLPKEQEFWDTENEHCTKPNPAADKYREV